jgi:hypothetical protein
MAGNKYLALASGTATEVASANSSAGAADANKIVSLNASGVIDATMISGGGGSALTTTVTTSEALAAGDFVNLFNSSGLKAQKANATTAAKRAHGYVLAAFGSGASATVYTNSINTAVTGQTVGADVFLSTTAGGATGTAPSTTGNIVQPIGVALSATSVLFEPQTPVTLA